MAKNIRVVKKFIKLRIKYKEENNVIATTILEEVFRFYYYSGNRLKKGESKSFTIPISNCFIEAATVLSDLGYYHYSIQSLKEDGVKVIIRNNI